jgi:pimeloyl-ACP methyl ester carboxylesterase
MRRAVVGLLLVGVVLTGARWLRAGARPRTTQDFWVTTRNTPQATIAGHVIYSQAGTARGTMIVCHGWHNSKEYCYGYDWVCKDPGWNMVCFDFREHGQSTHTRHLSSLGYHEIWDVKAVVDYAEQQGLAKPYAIYGVSMGASTGVRWASQDARIKGVLALSPYRSGLDACELFLWRKFHLVFDSTDLHAGLKAMLSAVNLPTDIAARNDLRLWILCGEHDWWPVSHEQSILDGSPSPPSFKKLFVIPGGNHGNLWAWKGNRAIPAHDQIVRDFLKACR